MGTVPRTAKADTKANPDRKEPVMFTLHIEHPVTTFDAWKAAFDRFAPMRLEAGVRSHHISRPLDDAKYVLIDLDFDSADAAEKFLAFLRTQVWASPQNAPALAGTPHTRILESVERSSAQ
jgi:hypothetical protein